MGYYHRPLRLDLVHLKNISAAPIGGGCFFIKRFDIILPNEALHRLRYEKIFFPKFKKCVDIPCRRCYNKADG